MLVNAKSKFYNIGNYFKQCPNSYKFYAFSELLFM